MTAVVHGLVPAREATETVTVYSLRDPRTGRIGFIGASRKPREQVSKNLYLANHTYTLGPLYRFLRELQAERVRPEIVTLEVTTKAEAPARISYWKAALPWAPGEPYRHTRSIKSPRDLRRSGLIAVSVHVNFMNPPVAVKPERDPYVLRLKQDLRKYFPRFRAPSPSTRSVPAEAPPKPLTP